MRKRIKIKTHSRFLLLFIAGVIIIIVSLSAGTRVIMPGSMIDILLGDTGSIDYTILVKLRLPRLILAIIIGSSLAVSGTVFQAVLKNPLADPYIIGVSGGAALGATAGILFDAGNYAVAAAAFAGSLATITMVYLMSKRMRLGSNALILSGIALGFILSAAVLLMYALSRSEQIHRAMLWLMGDLSGARYPMLAPLGTTSLIFMAALMFFHKHLDIISVGDRFSKNLGVTELDIRILFWIASLLSAISVSLAGVIGFVGLIMPHLMRNIVGPGHRRLLPAAAIGGALFLAASDAIGRAAIPPYEIPVGIITGFAGGVFFLIYMMRGVNQP